jgi:hypothetical protein
MGRWILTAADRDADGKIAVDRSLADLLPPLPAAEDNRDKNNPIIEPLPRRQLAGSAAVVVLLALALFALSRSTAPATSVVVRPAAPVPTAAAPPINRLELATSAPTIAPPTIARMIVAYAAPGGDVLGPILLPAAALARYGDGWIQVAWHSGRVWVRTSDAPSLALASLADLQPPTPAPVVIVPPAAPIGQQAAPAEPTTDRTHERSTPDDRGPPTSVPAFTVR